MKLIVVIMEDDLSHILSKELLENKISSTKLSSTGGFLKKGNTTMLIGTDVEKERSILDLIKKVCDENDIESDNESKANIFVMDLEDFKKF
ncbi:MAG: cyclic-di-AMP receptor [Finegoldia magna]|uniref:cyclic-di-AMP receptor n=1 Tax=Finegoldia sp. TaxID=1981334 RepID=UPI0025EB20BE|nr:cyclic-di-AMP receptor [uncultured Finegoldia sp.]MDU5977926.1 cyclic-di-AMP receptor [Finegoldia magna]